MATTTVWRFGIAAAAAAFIALAAFGSASASKTPMAFMKSTVKAHDVIILSKSYCPGANCQLMHSNYLPVHGYCTYGCLLSLVEGRTGPDNMEHLKRIAEEMQKQVAAAGAMQAPSSPRRRTTWSLDVLCKPGRCIM
ncbi:Glutaredoxin-C8 [Hordeum vulgare]|nr:Glutaredoxin-C8 [Hordeum vulgare]